MRERVAGRTLNLKEALAEEARNPKGSPTAEGAFSQEENDAPRFTFSAYVADLGWAIAGVLTGTAILGVMLGVLGLGVAAICTCCGFVAALFALVLVGSYLRRRRFYQQLASSSTSLQHAYYLASQLAEPSFLEGRIFCSALQEVCRADGRDLQEERRKLRAQQEFVDMWVHEVKTPIAASKLTLARMHGPDASALKLDVERIEAACERALYNTRAESLSQDYDLREVFLLPLCQEACKSLSSLLIHQGVAPRFEIPDSLVAIADRSWVTFVIRQLISNCAKYGATCITFSAWSEQAGTTSGKVVLQVTDDGVGIPADEVPHVFERGFSGSNGRAEGTSTGMGLYIAAKLCQAMGVGLSLGSELGKGTRVLLIFPLYDHKVTEL
ncbi:MAG: sensor histidine kinase [Eggerthellaceae bacterium]